jgi:hypothetical protein
MKKIIQIIISMALLCISAYANNLPVIGGSITNSNINAGTGNNSFLIPVNDGDLLINQNVTVTAISSNSSVLQITSVDYSSDNTFASINVFAGTIAGIVTVTVNAIDVDGASSKSFIVGVGDFWPKGVRLKVYDIAFWTGIVPSKGTSFKMDTVINGGAAIPQNDVFYKPAKLTVGAGLVLIPWAPNDYANGMTTGMTGYIVPTISGLYSFKFHTQDGGAFFLNTVDGGNLYDANMVKRLHTSDSVFTINLQAGHYYPFRTVNWIVFTKNFTLLWTGPGINAFTEVSPPYVYPDFDRIKPTIPTSLSLVNKGVAFMTLKWKGSSDNDKVNNYNLYSNGVKIASIKDSLYVATGLSPNTLYSFAVTAVDRVGNESLISNVISASTYAPDNIPPTPPTQITFNSIADMSAEIVWSGASDVGSEVIGYYVYLNGKLYNTTYTTDNSMVLKVLVPKSNDTVSVQAIDGAFNFSVKSTNIAFTTLPFDETILSKGIKKAKSVIYPISIARNPGFGINFGYVDKASYNGFYSGYLSDLEPGIFRWGTLDANVKSFSNHTGPGRDTTIGKFMNLAIESNSYASFTCGVTKSTDWIQDPATFTRFMEYIGDPTGATPGGSLRVAEGYVDPFISNIKGIVIELGNEVCWSTNAAIPGEIGDDWGKYGKWCRDMAKIIKSSPYYDSTKIFISYSSRSPVDSYGGNQALLFGDKHEVDWMSISGYMGGNLGYDAKVPSGASELLYYKSGTKVMVDFLKGLEDLMDQDQGITGKYRPFFYYEANMTTPDYNGRLGQAVEIADYFFSAMKLGLAFPVDFALAGGEWSMIDASNGNAKLPFFNISELMNKNTKGNILKSEVKSIQVLQDENGLHYNADPVGIHAFNVIDQGSTKYAIAMFSREFDSDYQVQIVLPKNGIYGTVNSKGITTAKRYILSGSDFSTRTAITSVSTIPFHDSLIVTVPAYSAVLYVFDGPDLGHPLLPLGYTKYKKIDLIKIIATSPNSNIDVQYGSATFTVSAVSFAVIDKRIGWNIQIPEGADISFDSTSGSAIKILSNGTCEGNGVVTITAYSVEDPSVRDQIMVTVSGQVTEGFVSCITSIKDNLVGSKVNIYPNPTEGVINIVTNSENLSKIRIYDLTGILVFESLLQPSLNSQQVKINNLAQGLYFVHIENKKGEVFKRKLMKK